MHIIDITRTVHEGMVVYEGDAPFRKVVTSVVSVELERMVRTDCTVEESNIHEPTDSSLLFDVVRVLARLMRQEKQAGYDIAFVVHTRGAKRRVLGIQHAKNKQERTKLYRRLVKLCEETIDDALRAIVSLDDTPNSLNHRSDVIFLKGLPDVPESRPHSSVNS